MLSVGQDTIISVDGTIYIGTITFSTDRYINIQATELKTYERTATKFYTKELTSVKPLKQRGNASDEAVCDLTLQDLCLHSKILRNYSFIERFDRTYHDAIEDIESESFIGFDMPGISSGRFAESSVMAIRTSRSIYVFDIQVMGRMEKTMKSILEANVPKKIIHGACRVADHLKHKQNINLNGVFDTMVCCYGFDKKRTSLDECLHDHLQLPDKFVDQATEQWNRRPLSSHDKRVAGQLVVFLPKLHSKLSRMALQSIVDVQTS